MHKGVEYQKREPGTGLGRLREAGTTRSADAVTGRFRITNLRLQISNLKFQISNFKFLDANPDASPGIPEFPVPASLASHSVT